MKHHPRLIIGSALVLVAALVAVIAGQSYAIGNMAAQPTAVGTIDINKVFEGLNQRADIDARLQALANELQDRADLHAEEIDELQEEVEAYTPGSDNHQEALEKLRLKSLEYRAFVEFSGRKLEVHKALELRRLFEDIRKSVEVLALEMGYDIVLADDSVNPITGGTEQEVRLQVLTRQILFANDKVDLTDVLIETMNQA